MIPKPNEKPDLMPTAPIPMPCPSVFEGGGDEPFSPAFFYDVDQKGLKFLHICVNLHIGFLLKIGLNMGGKCFL